MAEPRPGRPRRLALLLPDMRGGGAERVALRLAEDFLGAGHAVDLVLMEARGELLDLLPSQVRVFDLHAPRIRSAIAPLRRYLRERRPDAIQVSMWPLTVAAVIAHRLARSRARVVLSDHIVLSKQYAHFGVVRRLLRRLSIRLAYPLADARVLVSRQAADDLARISGISRDSIDVVYNPVSRPTAASQPVDAAALWGDADGRIITVGSLKAQKNHALLIRSFARLRAKRRARLLILGDGPLRGELEALVASQGLSGEVLMPGFVTDPWPYYETADLFALSSDYEGYPLVLIEALRSGLTVVSTDCESGPREILDGGRYGRLVPVGDEAAFAAAMEQALAGPGDPAPLQARAEALSGQGTSDRYLQLMLGMGCQSDF
ncbi:MAG: glycosyltransferase, partial [Sphingomonadales bacterium]